MTTNAIALRTGVEGEGKLLHTVAGRGFLVSMGPQPKQH